MQGGMGGLGGVVHQEVRSPLRWERKVAVSIGAGRDGEGLNGTHELQ